MPGSTHLAIYNMQKQQDHSRQGCSLHQINNISLYHPNKINCHMTVLCPTFYNCYSLVAEPNKRKIKAYLAPLTSSLTDAHCITRYSVSTHTDLRSIYFQQTTLKHRHGSWIRYPAGFFMNYIGIRA